MKKEEIKSLEDAMQYITEIEEIQDSKTIEIDGLNAKMKDMETASNKLVEENNELKQRCYDLFMKIPRQGQVVNYHNEIKEEPAKSLDDILNED